MSRRKGAAAAEEEEMRKRGAGRLSAEHVPAEPGALLEEIRRMARSLGQVQLMEICGTHTMAIARAGLKSLLPENIRLISGPGCPVCVTPAGAVDELLRISSIPGVIMASYGDYEFLRPYYEQALWLQDNAAARCGGTSCQSVQGQGNADGRAADGEGEGDADKGGDQHAHEEGLHLRGSFYEVPKPGHEARYAGADELGSEHTGDDGGSRSDEDVQTRFFGDDFAQLRRDDGGDQGAYGAAQVISRKAYGGGREKDELWGI